MTKPHKILKLVLVAVVFAATAGLISLTIRANLGQALGITLLQLVLAAAIGYGSICFLIGRPEFVGLHPKLAVRIGAFLAGLLGIGVSCILLILVYNRFQAFHDFHQFVAKEAVRIDVGCHVFTDSKQLLAIMASLREASGVDRHNEDWDAGALLTIRATSGQVNDYMIAHRLYRGQVVIPLNGDRSGLLVVPQLAEILQRAGAWRIKSDTSPGSTDDVIIPDITCGKPK